MVVCCRCNRTGQCRGCACVKAGKLCSSCLPSRLGSCSNVGRRQDPVSCETTTTYTPANLSTTSTAVSPSPTPVCEVVSIPDSSSQNQSTSNPRNESSSLSPAPTPVLPPYDPMREQDFLLGATQTHQASVSPSKRFMRKSPTGGRTAFKCHLAMLGSLLWQN